MPRLLVWSLPTKTHIMTEATPTTPIPCASTAVNFSLIRNAHGRLELTFTDGTLHTAITPIRAFPLEAPQECISLLGQDGREIYWIERLDTLPASIQTLLQEEFAVREFVPIIQHIVAVDSISVPSTWTLETDRGPARMVLKAEEDIRKLVTAGMSHPHHLLITSRDGVQYRIVDIQQLDRHSQKLLERFL